MSERKTDLETAQERHIYTDPRTGKRVTSVTAVVGAFDSGDKLGRGAAAAAKLERQGINYRENWDNKRDTGTRVHEFAKLWMEGRTAEIPAEDAPHMDAFARWCNVVYPEWLHAEAIGVGTVECPHGPCAVCDDTGQLGFGGRFDAHGLWEDSFWLGDFKTGRAYRRELTIQIAGYAHFDGLVVHDESGRAVDLLPMPHIDKWCGIYITPQSVSVVEVPHPGKVSEDWTDEQMKAEAFETFRSLLFVKEWSKQMERKGR